MLFLEGQSKVRSPFHEQAKLSTRVNCNHLNSISYHILKMLCLFHFSADEVVLNLIAIVLCLPSFYSTIHVFIVIWYTTPYKKYVKQLISSSVRNIFKRKQSRWQYCFKFSVQFFTAGLNLKYSIPIKYIWWIVFNRCLLVFVRKGNKLVSLPRVIVWSFIGLAERKCHYLH